MQNFIPLPTSEEVSVSVKPSKKLDESAVAVIKAAAAKEVRELVAEREGWEAGVFRTVNLALYALLAKCYAIEQTMASRTAEARARRLGMEEVAEQLGYSFQGETVVMNKVVRCVFGDVAANRVSMYAAALREAKSRGIAVADLPAFLEESNGVEGVTRAKKAGAGGVSESEKAAQALKFVEGESLGVAQGALLSQRVLAEEILDAVVLIASPQDDGSFVINAIVKSKSAMTAALVGVYSANVQALQQEQAQKAQAVEVLSQAEARQAVVAEVIAPVADEALEMLFAA